MSCCLLSCCLVVCVNTSCNLNKSIERTCVMVLVSFDINGKRCCYSASMTTTMTTTTINEITIRERGERVMVVSFELKGISNYKDHTFCSASTE